MRMVYSSTATQKRLAAYSGNKSSFATVSGVTFRGYFTPVEPSQKTAALGIVGQGFEFYTDGHKDIRINDILIISSTDYGVMGVARYTMGSRDFLKCTLQLTANV